MAEAVKQIEPGQKIPDLKIKQIRPSAYEHVESNAPGAACSPTGIADAQIGEIFAGKKAVLFCVPGAFTPGCAQRHLPPFVEKREELKELGIELVACIAVNDAFTMKAWGRDQGVGDKVLMLADGNGDWVKAAGLELDLRKYNMGVRGIRFAMVLDDGVVKHIWTDTSDVVNTHVDNVIKTLKAEKLCEKLPGGPVRREHKFNEERLCEYLKTKIPGFSAPLIVRQFEGGQSNPTFLLVTPTQKYVLRKKPPGKLLPSAHAVDREYRVLTALGKTDVPVAKTYCYCEDDSVIGTAFYVMEFLDGRVIRDNTLSDFSPKERSAMYASLIDTLARLHNVNLSAVGLADFGAPGNYYARQLKTWTRQYQMSKTEEQPEMDELLEWLSERVPVSPNENESVGRKESVGGVCVRVSGAASYTPTLVHGDFRMENMMFHKTESRIIGVLDWELATTGHPLSDLAYLCMVFYMPASNSSLSGLGVPSHSIPGIPQVHEFVEEYCRLTHRNSIPDFHFYLAFSFFRLAAILQGVYKRGLDGNASSSTALAQKDRVLAYARYGLNVTRAATLRAATKL